MKFCGMSIIVTLLNTLLLAAILIGVIALEVWLSRRKSRWPGLIMPILGFVLSLFMVLGFAGYAGGGAKAVMQSVNEQTGEVTWQEQPAEPEQKWTWNDTAQVGLVLLVGNIPTFVLLGAYCIGREKLRREKLLNRMHIQDL